MPECTPAQRTCSKCGQPRPLTGRCGTCRAAYERMRYRNNAEVRRKRSEARERDRDKLRAYHAEYYQKNRERKIAAACEYQKLNPVDLGYRRQRERKWRAANAERYAEVKRAWQANNAELVAESRRRSASRRRARMAGLPAEPYTLLEIIERDGPRCVLCDGELDLTAKWPEPKAPTVEHLECISWPESAGDVLANVAASHFGCNLERGTRPHPAAARKRAALLTTGDPLA